MNSIILLTALITIEILGKVKPVLAKVRIKRK